MIFTINICQFNYTIYINNTEVNLMENKKFYQKIWFMWLMLFLFFPVGIFLLYKYSDYSKKTKAIIACLSVLLCIVANSNSHQQTANKAASTQEISEKNSKQNKTLSTEEKITEICKKQLRDDFLSVEINDNANVPNTKIVLVHFKYENLTTSMTREGMIMESSDIMEKLYTADLPISEVVTFVETGMVDKYGNESRDTVMKCGLTKDVAGKINWGNKLSIDFSKVFTQYWVHPALNKE